MTKEHIWSDWLSDIFPPLDKHHSRTFFRLHHDPEIRTAFVQPEFGERKNGAFMQRKIRKVCGACNGGWMSVAVDKAKPSLVPLMLSKSGGLVTEQALVEISTWFTIAAIMAEFTDPEFQRIPKNDWVELCRTRSPLPSWTIALARYQGTEWSPTRYRHWGADYMIDTFPPKPLGSAQISTKVLGNLVLCAISSNSPLLVEKARSKIRFTRMRVIWPWPSAFDSNTLAILSDKEINEVSLLPLNV